MEPHPVPQNILDVEFKLFGAFTLRQFIKIVIGCLFALVAFFIIPADWWYLQLPIMLLSIGVGVGIALVPNLGIWISAFIRSLFVSPRYVWEKETKAPEALTASTTKKATNSQNVSKTTKANYGSEEISLERLLQSSKPSTQGLTSGSSLFGDDVTNSADPKLEKVMKQVYERQKKRKKTGKKKIAQVSQQSTKPKARQKTREDYMREINALRSQMANLVKDQNYKEKEAEMLERIADLQQDMKFLPDTPIQKQQDPVGTYTQQTKQDEVERDAKGALIEQKGQAVFGIAVDKQDNPVAGGQVLFTSTDGNLTYSAPIAEDGRFATPQKLQHATYDVRVQHPNLQFHTYRITVKDAKLPAYKFRAK